MGRGACCAICGTGATDAGTLCCDHGFCGDCFARYVHGSLAELRCGLRCCLCGSTTRLSTETKGELTVLRFGRDFPPKLVAPVGVCCARDGCYVTADAASGRVLVYDARGLIVNHFAYLHNTQPMRGIAVTRDGVVVLPSRDRKYMSLAMYTSAGVYLRSAYLPDDSQIEAVAVTPDNHVIAADSYHRCLYVFDEHQRRVRTIRLSRTATDDEEPCPRGVAVNRQGALVVSDGANHCVRALDADGRPRWTAGGRGERPGQFCDPRAVSWTDDGHIVVADTGNQRVQRITSDGRFCRYIVRYNRGDSVYMSPTDVVSVSGPGGGGGSGGLVAVLLTSTGSVAAAEIRVYPCD